MTRRRRKNKVIKKTAEQPKGKNNCNEMQSYMKLGKKIRCTNGQVKQRREYPLKKQHAKTGKNTKKHNKCNPFNCIHEMNDGTTSLKYNHTGTRKQPKNYPRMNKEDSTTKKTTQITKNCNESPFISFNKQ